jgi:hypothetical protein
MKSISTTISFILVVLIFSCKPRKLPVSGPLSVDNKNLVQFIDSSRWNWTEIAARADLDIQDGEGTKRVNVSIRMKKDSLIWLSIGFFGIEGARVLINKDSMTILDKFNHSYSVLQSAELTKYTGSKVSVGELQNALLGLPILASGLYKIFLSDETRLTISGNKEQLEAMHTYLKNNSRLEKSELFNLADREQKSVISYSDFKEQDGKIFPFKLEINGQSKGQSNKIILAYKQIELKSEQSYPFNLDGYKKD